MSFENSKQTIKAYDSRRDLVVPGDHQATLLFCIDHFLAIAQESIDDHGYFAVALSGGATPKAIYQGLADPIHRLKIDWSKIFLFWSDERNVPPYDPESNYRMAMDAAFSHLPVPAQNIHRMQAEGDIEEGALAYDNLIKVCLKDQPFDLVMLGMGEDGHTASLFPRTHGLHTIERKVIANCIPQKNTWRMTLTFDCINAARHIVLYVIGKNKANILSHVLTKAEQPDEWPVQKIGTLEHKLLIIADKEAVGELSFSKTSKAW
jgi:6-phosphogluconolactonase